MPWRTLRHPSVRDLAWSLLSPPLFVEIPASGVRVNHLQPSASLIRWLQQLDHNPEPLLKFLAERSTRRVGHYFEALWQFHLQHNHQLLLDHHQIQQLGRTIGEVDFIYREQPSRRLLHAETAVKFYLGRAVNLDSSSLSATTARNRYPRNWQQWVGPDGRDRLDIKLPHMLNHQLSMGRYVASMLQIESSPDDCPALPEPELILRGRLFYPLNDSVEPPEGANSNHLRGFWCYAHQVTDAAARWPDLTWKHLSRVEYLAPLSLDLEHNDDQAKRIDNLQRLQANTTSSSVELFAAGRLDKNCWHEQFRLFVVDPLWPGLS